MPNLVNDSILLLPWLGGASTNAKPPTSSLSRSRIRLSGGQLGPLVVSVVAGGCSRP
jgi:hypothetical protein